MKKSRLLGALCVCVFSFISMSANAALISRLGGQAYYDDVLDVTWLADMDLAYSEKFGVPGIATNMSGFTAQEYIIAMNNYDDGVGWLGVNNWRLPTTLIPDSSCTQLDGSWTSGTEAVGYNCTGSELGHLYYEELGGTAGGGLPGLGGVAPDLSLFTKYSGGTDYWTSPELRGGDNPVAVWFTITTGYQGHCHYDCGALVWSVADGDVAAVPIPPALWLFGSGLLGLISIARGKRAA